jgi:acetyl esterase/lipase
MTGLPPMQIFVSRDEVLRDDGVRLAEKAKARGVDCELHVVAGMPHVWPLFAPFLPEGRESLAQVGAFINRVAAERYRCQN